eukprot:776542_1
MDQTPDNSEPAGDTDHPPDRSPSGSRRNTATADDYGSGGDNSHTVAHQEIDKLVDAKLLSEDDGRLYKERYNRLTSHLLASYEGEKSTIAAARRLNSEFMGIKSHMERSLFHCAENELA